MITATARLLGTITATAVIFSTQTGSCAAATAVIKDSAGTTLQTESIPSGVSEDITISDSTVNVNKSNGALISAVAVKAENTASYNVSDSVAVLKDTLGNTLLTENIRATETENIIAPDATINVNGNLFSVVESGATLNIPVKNTAGTNVGTIAVGMVEVQDASVTARNSLGTAIGFKAAAAEAVSDLNLADTTYNFYVNNVLKDTQTVPTLENETFQIYFV